LTAEEFERLLAFLHSDRERAARTYENLRQGLIRRLTTRFKVSDPEGMTDLALDRFARRLAEGLELENRDPMPFLYGIAGKLAQEDLRRQIHRDHKLQNLPGPMLEAPRDLVEEEDTARRRDGLARCLEKLPHDRRNLVLDYYTGSDRIKSRHRLAEELGLTLNALRIRAHRARLELEDCLRRRLSLSLRGGK
jgi:DNA-directed RNA polymerase specialized sigma24 family protein